MYCELEFGNFWENLHIQEKIACVANLSGELSPFKRMKNPHLEILLPHPSSWNLYICDLFHYFGNKKKISLI